MADQKKLHKVLMLIRLLNTPPAKNVSQLIRLLGSTKSRVYEYLQLLEKVGYRIKTDRNHRKSFDFVTPRSGEGALGADELHYLQDLLQRFGGQDLHAKNILYKFDLNLSLIPIADALPQLHRGRIIQLLRVGINTSSRLVLRNYRSLTSQTVKDRYVEALEITPDARYLIAWDLDKDDQRQFKIDRIEDVDLLDEKMNPKHVASPMDIFGLTGTAWLSVRMELSPTAHHLLLEEFPLSQSSISKKGDKILFEGQVRHWKGIGRFVLGLPGEIKVLEPPAFKTYLQEKIEEF